MRNKMLGRDERALLKLVLDHEDDLTAEEHKAFLSMYRYIERAQTKGEEVRLSAKQSTWLSAVAKRLDVVEPAANLVSRGLVPRGAEVPTPPILLNRPLKPPGR